MHYAGKCFNTASLATIIFQYRQSVKRVFNVSDFLIDNTLQTASPFTNAVDNQAPWQCAPPQHDRLLQLINRVELPAVLDWLLQSPTNSIIYRIYIRSVGSLYQSVPRRGGMVTGPRRSGDVPVVEHPPPGSTRSVVTRVLQRLRPCS